MWKFYFALVFLLSVMSRSLSYEECNEKNIDFTNQVSTPYAGGTTEAQDPCIGCYSTPSKLSDFKDSSSRIKSLFRTDKVYLNEIPKKCFLRSVKGTSENSKGKGRYRLCSTNGTKTTGGKNNRFYSGKPYLQSEAPAIYVHRPCASEAYITAVRDISEALAKCIGLPMEEVFSLVHHESKFVVNNISGTNAKCFGMLTTATIQDINKLNDSMFSGFDRKLIKPSKREALKIDTYHSKCKLVSKHFTGVYTYDHIPNQNKYWHSSERCTKARKRYYKGRNPKKTREIVKKIDDIAEVIYLGFEGKLRHLGFDALLELKNKGYLLERDFETLSIRLLYPKDIHECKKRHFTKFSDKTQVCNLLQNPVSCMVYTLMNYKRNRMLVEGVLEKKGKIFVTTNHKKAGGPGRPLIFKDQKTLKEFRDRTKKYGIYKGLKTKESLIFSKPEEVKKIVAQFAYNGGSSVPANYFTTFLDKLSEDLDNRLNADLRKDWLDGGLSTKWFYQQFRDYIVTNYPGTNARKKEVANFVYKINRDLFNLRDKDCPQPNLDILRLKGKEVSQ